jgi:flagellar export protein FliJ
MKSRDINIKLRRFELNEKRQVVTDLESMIADFRRMSDDLQRQIEMEEQKSGIKDVNHFAYPSFARSAVKRRENLLSSIADLETRLEAARNSFDDAVIEVNKAELAGEMSHERERHMPTSDMMGMPPHAAIRGV